MRDRANVSKTFWFLPLMIEYARVVDLAIRYVSAHQPAQLGII